jgi:hypothetical protein
VSAAGSHCSVEPCLETPATPQTLFARVVQGETARKTEQSADACTTYRRQLFCCFSLPLLRDNAGCDGESGHEISSGVCLLFSRT